jgi:hypothetical protein
MDQQIVNMLSVALDRAQRGEIAAIAIITSDAQDVASVGYLDRDHSSGLDDGIAFLLASLTLNPDFDEGLDPEFPARALGPIDKSVAK